MNTNKQKTHKRQCRGAK